MSETTAIEWCDSTFNPWIGCTKVSPACDDCYAARSTPARTMGIEWGPGMPRRRTAPATWALPKRWNDAHAEFFAQHCRRRRVFCASLADVFDNEVPADWRSDLFALIADTPNLDWLLLTKRIGNAAAMMGEALGSRWRDVGTLPLPNVWLGATVVGQAEADRDIPKLLATPAAVRFLSIEPMLGWIDARVYLDKRERLGFRQDAPCLDWVIAGGESGPKARPSHPDWYRSLRDQCAAAGVPFLFKQWGEWLPAEVDCTTAAADDGSERELPGERLAVHTFPDRQQMARIGKKAAGRMLDGVEHNGFPS